MTGLKKKEEKLVHHPEKKRGSDRDMSGGEEKGSLNITVEGKTSSRKNDKKTEEKHSLQQAVLEKRGGRCRHEESDVKRTVSERIPGMRLKGGKSSGKRFKNGETLGKQHPYFGLSLGSAERFDGKTVAHKKSDQQKKKGEQRMR